MLEDEREPRHSSDRCYYVGRRTRNGRVVSLHRPDAERPHDLWLLDAEEQLDLIELEKEALGDPLARYRIDELKRRASDWRGSDEQMMGMAFLLLENAECYRATRQTYEAFVEEVLLTLPHDRWELRFDQIWKWYDHQLDAERLERWMGEQEGQ